MEFEILNDILTSTVSKLFPNSVKHINYFKFEEDYVKSEIPKISNKNEDLFGTNKKEEQQQIIPIMNSNLTKKEEYNNNRRLEEALKRLNLDEAKCKNKHLVDLPLDTLLSEKTKVKNELKRYDNEFLELNQRLPNRNEKESMRIIYVYYKYLKQAITIKQNVKEKEPEKNNYLKTNKDENKISPKENLKSPVATNNINNYNYGSQNSSISNYSNSTKSNKDLNIQNKPTEKFSFNSEKFDLQDNNKKSTKVANFINKVYSKAEIVELENELEKLKKEQFNLKNKLHNFQKEFYEVNNRRVKYYKDIIGVEDDYKKYKDNKSKMTDISEILSKLKK